MAESDVHIRLVRNLVTWANTTLKPDHHSKIFVDLPETTPGDKPPQLLGFSPDLYCEASVQRAIFVGEAKTARDLETRHSKEQFAAYLRYLGLHERGCLIVAVPWYAVPRARSIVRSLQRLTGMSSVSTVFLDQLAG